MNDGRLAAMDSGLPAAREKASVSWTDGTDSPECPACGHAQVDWAGGLAPIGDGDSWETACGQCGADMTVTVAISYTFITTLSAPADSPA